MSGIPPSCCIKPRASRSAHCSVILPPTQRKISVLVTSACFPRAQTDLSRCLGGRADACAAWHGSPVQDAQGPGGSTRCTSGTPRRLRAIARAAGDWRPGRPRPSRHERLAIRCRRSSCRRVHRCRCAFWNFDAGVLLVCGDVIRNAMRALLAELITSLPSPVRPFLAAGARCTRCSREMCAAWAREREVTASPHASSSAAALAIRVCPAARRASASGSPSGVNCGRLVHGALPAGTGPRPRTASLATRPSYRSGRLRWAHSGQFGPDEGVGHSARMRGSR
jgi:hypothetical protein